jgi:hypothetical protein
MHRIIATVLGIVVGLLGIVGLFVEGDHLLGIMNVDMTLDILRLVLAAALLIVGLVPRVPNGAPRAVVIVVGVLYVGMGLLAFADRTLFGLLPTGLTGFDIGFHLVVGVAAVVLGVLPDRAIEKAADAVTPGTSSSNSRSSNSRKSSSSRS